MIKEKWEGLQMNNIMLRLEITANMKEHNVNQGVRLNQLTFRKPNSTYICDASEYGLGGFATHGRSCV